MKVVLFCGGQGLRLREYAESVPKPMAPIGPRPVLWHVMRTYAQLGHRDFILCLGYKAEVIKDYFLRYNEALSNDFVLSDGGRSVELISSDIQDWKITFADTGLDALIGQRLRAVRRYVEPDDLFLASYGDCLTDAPLNDFRSRDAAAAFLAVRPSYTFHVVETDGERVERVRHVRDADIWINGGYFVLRPEIFDAIGPGEDLVNEPFARLIEAGRLLAYRYDGFWMPMDTLKEMQDLERLYQAGNPPWAHWLRED
jgi:glucose-1-phosphate cytidylyltransferase